MTKPIAAGQNAGALRPGALQYLAFFEHYRGTSVMQAGDLDPGFNRGPSKLADCVADLLARKPQYVRKTGLQFAVADLSKDKRKPDSAGNKIDDYWEAASSSKIGIAYAAFQMLQDLNALATLNAGTLKTAKDLWNLAQSKWLATQTWAKTTTALTTPAGQPTLELADRLLLKTKKGDRQRRMELDSYARPQPQNIFDATPSGGVLQVTFKQPKLPAGSLLWQRPVARGEFGDVDDLAYIEKLYTALDASNNEGANASIKDLGFLYIASALMQSNLFDLSAANGLWVGRFYPYGDKLRAPVPDPLARTPDKQEIYAAHSPRSGVTFMTLLEQDWLLDKAGCDAIRDMLDRSMGYAATPNTTKTATGTRSPVADGLQAKGIVVDEIYSKIGIGGRNNIWDIALVKRTTPAGRDLNYAITICDSVIESGDPQDGPLTDLAYDLDQCVVAANP